MSWRKVETKKILPSPRAYASAIIKDNLFYVFGGGDKKAYFNNLFAYDFGNHIFETKIKFD